MVKTLAPMIFLIAAGTAQAAMLPGNAATGKTLHDKQCVACHTTSLVESRVRHVGPHAIEGLRAKGCVVDPIELNVVE